MLDLPVTRAEIGDEKQGAEGQVYSSEEQVGGTHALLGHEKDDRDGPDQLFEDGGDHDGAEADGVAGDEDKGQLPDKREAGKTVIEGRMCNRRRVLFANRVEQEIEGRNDEEAPDTGDPEHNFGKFHEERLP